MGLLPGKAERTPSICSLTDDWMLHEVDGSLIPPMTPGHLSMPESPASQLSMICCRVGMSHPAICWTVSADHYLGRRDNKSAYEISMKGVSGIVTVREHERLCTLALSPPLHKQRRVPVDFVEDVRSVDVALGAVHLLTPSTGTAGPGHVILVVLEASSRVIARREVDISTKRRGVAVAVHVWKTSTGTFVVWVLHPNPVHTIGVCRVGVNVVVGARACELDGLDSFPAGGIKDLGTAGGRWRAELRVANEHTKTLREGHNLVVGRFEAGDMSVMGLRRRNVGLKSYK